eukprot:7146566-Prymnesium_polylepis.1
MRPPIGSCGRHVPVNGAAAAVAGKASVAESEKQTPVASRAVKPLRSGRSVTAVALAAPFSRRRASLVTTAPPPPGDAASVGVGALRCAVGLGARARSWRTRRLASRLKSVLSPNSCRGAKLRLLGST